MQVTENVRNLFWKKKEPPSYDCDLLSHGPDCKYGSQSVKSPCKAIFFSVNSRHSQLKGCVEGTSTDNLIRYIIIV